MNKKRLVRYLELRTLSHATENKQKVIKAIYNLFPESSPFIVGETILKGYFGDTIVSLKIEINNRKICTNFLNHVIRNLNSIDYESLLEELPTRIDASKNLYLRFSKQKAYQGKISLESRDPIRVKFRLQIPHGSNTIEVIRTYFKEVTMG
jgi:RNA binding exosome subunit